MIRFVFSMVCLCITLLSSAQLPNPKNPIPTQSIPVGDRVLTVSVEPVLDNNLPYKITIKDKSGELNTVIKHVADLDIGSITDMLTKTINGLGLEAVNIPDLIPATTISTANLVSDFKDLLATVDPTNAPKCLEVFVKRKPVVYDWIYCKTDSDAELIGFLTTTGYDCVTTRSKKYKHGFLSPTQDTTEVEKVELNLKDGVLTSVSATVLVNGKREVFISSSPMPISHRDHLLELHNIALVNPSIPSRIVILDEVITMVPIGDGGYPGINPGNVTLEISGWKLGVKNPIFKQQRQHIFDFRIYSDFIGLLQSDQPNGVVQAELSKRLHMNRDYVKFTDRYNGSGIMPNKDPVLHEFPKLLYRGFSHVDFYLSAAKIQDEINPPVGTSLVSFTDAENNSIHTPNVKIESLDPVQYQSFRVGGDMSHTHFDIIDVDLKLDLFIGIGISGFNLQRPSGFDTVLNQFEIDPVTAYSAFVRNGFVLEFNPEKRYGFRLNAAWIINHSITDGVLYNPNKPALYEQRHVDLLSTGLDIFFEVNEQGGKIFFRMNRFSRMDQLDKSHVQLQFGYSRPFLQVLEENIPSAY